MFLKSLSGRFLILTIVFVMLAEVLIFVPSIARYRETYLMDRLERAQIASLAKESVDMIDPNLEEELLRNAGVFNVVLRRDEMRQLMLNSDIPSPVAATYIMTDAGPLELIRDAIAQLFRPDDEVIRVVGRPVQGAGILIEITLPTGPLREALIDYGIRILILSAIISILTASLLFFVVRRVLVKPIKGVVGAMKSYAEAPEDSRRIIQPSADVLELNEAELALQSLQTDLTAALRQKERLAQLGGAVAKISHDLRNILTVAQLFGDRIETSEDPAVRRMAPKLLGSISRAVNLCESTLAFGRAEEPPPVLDRIQLAKIADDVIEGERLAASGDLVTLEDEVPVDMVVRADPEQLFRVLSNLTRNARQAIEATGQPGRIVLDAEETDVEWVISVRDTGPGLPPKAQDNLFRAFQGGARKGGTGLGLAIAAELIRGHGGHLDMVHTSEEGTKFAIVLPKGLAITNGAVA
ncbi:MAG: HAMP domain-containing sensor histidine kinase [Pseudomonadota bacterium]